MEGLNVRQRKLVKGIVAGKGKQQAAIEANYSPISAASTATEILKHPKVQRAIDIALEKRGLNDDRITEVLDEGLRANKLVSVRAIKKSGEPIDADADTDDFAEIPDHAVRHKFLDTLVDLRGYKAPKDEGQPPVQVNILVQQTIDRLYGRDTKSSTPS